MDREAIINQVAEKSIFRREAVAAILDVAGYFELVAEVERLRDSLYWIARHPCANESTLKVYTSCIESDECITEYCLPCYARVALGRWGCES